MAADRTEIEQAKAIIRVLAGKLGRVVDEDRWVLEEHVNRLSAQTIPPGKRIATRIVAGRMSDPDEWIADDITGVDARMRRLNNFGMPGRVIDAGPRWKTTRWHRIGDVDERRQLSPVAVGVVARQPWIERLVGRLLNRALRWAKSNGQSLDREELDVHRWSASIVVDHATGKINIPLGGADTVEAAKKLVDDHVRIEHNGFVEYHHFNRRV